MKNLFYTSILFVFALFVTSCDDDDGEIKNDPVVGSWEVFEVHWDITTFENGEEINFERTLSTEESCSSPIIYSFSSNGTLTATDAQITPEGDQNLTCNVNDGQNVGNWEFVSGNTYILNEGENSSSQVEITFSNDNTTINILITNSQLDDEDPFEQIITIRANLIQ